MITGIGTDITRISRVNFRIGKRVLTEKEKIARKNNAQYIAGRFSLKESFFKALGKGIGSHSFKDISFLNNSEGKPYLVLHKDFEGFNFCHVSLSHDDYAFSTVILEKLEGKIFLALGSNIGNKEENLTKALELLKDAGITILTVSNIYETKPYGFTQQDNFFNIVVEVETHLSPMQLLKTVLSIEKKMGRKREIKWGPRNIDIDILFYGNLVVELDNLTIPHYDFENRNFFIVPMNEIAPSYKHPVTNISIKDYYENLDKKDQEVKNWTLKNLKVLKSK
ncbi:2-amino-4-hydroxy-6-hydroxymethyldihydropteridine diphosphokinase [Thermosipho ferrireducens]|uniref:Holo-[acyl-carrier-protein] synthase n=1 Tax=Thermosipho ferrireducens TaxID=2571116 RepID=A0ABX7S8H9_9BACT|nr:2-amino-4-hydroxy-6-hydroxymethyldihydropteridine diphosphokinase [Thermosipho ferrireducens]QTA38136.1 2-amino-4-hydroxy-6-hydroxymethyldihydropteridine diphosphokinase [Thermosipho ferrireducens]